MCDILYSKIIIMHTVPFKSKLTLDSQSSRESRIENQVENQDLIPELRLDSSNWNSLCYNPLSNKAFYS